METLGRTQSEGRRRLALAGGFGSSDRLESIDSTRGGTRRGAGRQAQMSEDFDNHRRIIDGGPSTRLGTGDNLQGTAAVGTVFHVDVEDAFEQPGPADARWRRRCRSRNAFTAQLRVGRQYAVEANQMETRAGAAPGSPGAP